MLARHIYRDEAVLRHAQPEALDELARVDLPHQYIAARMLGVLCLIALAWLALASTERAVRLDGLAAGYANVESSDAQMPFPSPSERLVEFSSFVSIDEAERISAGMAVDLLSMSNSKVTSVKGRLVSLQQGVGETGGSPALSAPLEHQARYRLLVAVPASHTLQSVQGPHRLRIVTGQQRLFELLMNSVTFRLDD